MDIKYCFSFCKNALINIINTCILENKFPDLWKKAIIVPIPKILNPNDLKDLRPISILPAISKILEKHIYHQILRFVEARNIIPNSQSGFRKNYSTSTCLVNLVNDVRCNGDKKEITCLCLLDFSKAFDTLCHRMLLAKLHYFGFSNDAVSFFESYLVRRYQCALINDGPNKLKSSYLSVNTGVPQGSILGPLLFCLYVADMKNEVLNSKLQQFADDSQLYVSFSPSNMQNFQIQLNDDLKNISIFAQDHNLKLNPTKSCVMLLGENKRQIANINENLNIVINQEQVPVVTEAKNLGIYFDTRLTFATHVKRKLSIAHLRLKKLYHLKKYLPSKTKYYLCNSLVLSLFDYGDVIYHSSLTNKIAKSIQKLQNTCMRFSFNITYRHHITPHLNNYSILSMHNRRKLHLYNFIYRILKSKNPPYLYQLFVSRNHPHRTRFIGDYLVPQHRSANFQKSFSFTATQMWNDIPNEKKYLSLPIFSKYIKNKLLSEQGAGG